MSGGDQMFQKKPFNSSDKKNLDGSKKKKKSKSASKNKVKPVVELDDNSSQQLQKARDKAKSSIDFTVDNIQMLYQHLQLNQKQRPQLNDYQINQQQMQLRGSQSQLSLLSTNRQLLSKMDTPDSFQTNMGLVTISVNSQNVLLSPPPAMRINENNLDVSRGSYKSIAKGGGANSSFASSARGVNDNNEVVFYESEYFYSSMPVQLPSDYQQQSVVVIGEDFLQRPQTSSNQGASQQQQNMFHVQSDLKSSYQGSQFSSVINASQSSFTKLKVQSLDLDEIIKKFPNHIEDSSQPKYLKFSVQDVYKTTGLPKPAQKGKEIEKEVFMVQNLFRVYKRLLIQILEDYAENQKRKASQQDQLQVTRKEGLSATLDAIDFIKKVPPLKPMYWNKLLSKVCRLHAEDCSKNNYTGHKNRKGEKPSQRMRKYGHVFFGGAQNILNGTKPGIESVLMLIIDDGVSSRGHRKNILTPAHRTIGIASEPHPSMGEIIICNYAFHYCHHKHPEPMKQIIQEWVQQDQAEIIRNIKLLNCDTFKYKVTFSYPFLVKATTLAKSEKDGSQKAVQDLLSKKNVEEILYKEIAQ